MVPASGTGGSARPPQFRRIRRHHPHQGWVPTAEGNSGRDRFVVYTNGGDAIIDGGPGKDTLHASRLNQPLRVDLKHSIDGGYAYRGQGDAEIWWVENVIGTRFRDAIGGSNRANVLEGMDGADLIKALGGNDDINGGFGDDTLDGTMGDDILMGGPGADRLSGGGGSDTCISGHPWWDSC